MDEQISVQPMGELENNLTDIPQIGWYHICFFWAETIDESKIVACFYADFIMLHCFVWHLAVGIPSFVIVLKASAVCCIFTLLSRLSNLTPCYWDYFLYCSLCNFRGLLYIMILTPCHGKWVEIGKIWTLLSGPRLWAYSYFLKTSLSCYFHDHLDTCCIFFLNKIFQDGIDELPAEQAVSAWAVDRKYLVSPINGVLLYHRLGKQERRHPEIPQEKASLALSDVSLTISEVYSLP